MTRSSVPHPTSRRSRRRKTRASRYDILSDEPRFRLIFIPVLLLASLLSITWLSFSQLSQLHDADAKAAVQRLTLWVSSRQAALEGQLREQGIGEEVARELLREPAPAETWLNEMFGREFAANTGVLLLGAVRGNGEIAVWNELSAGSLMLGESPTENEVSKWGVKQPAKWHQTLAPLLREVWRSPAQPQMAWMMIEGAPWLVGVQGLYTDETALPARDQQGLLILGMPMTSDMFQSQAKALGLHDLMFFNRATRLPMDSHWTCLALVGAESSGRHDLKACWKAESQLAAFINRLGAPLGLLLLVIVLSAIGAVSMIWRDSLRRKRRQSLERERHSRVIEHASLTDRLLHTAYDTHDTEHVRATLGQYLQQVREVMGADAIIYRREVGNPSAGYLILQSRDPREWLSEATLQRDPLWRLPAGPIKASGEEALSGLEDDRAVQLCQRLGATEMLGYSVSPHPGRSELLLIASRGHVLDETALLPLLDRTLNALIIRGLEQERIELQHKVLQERETDADTGLLSREGMLRLIRIRIDQLGPVAPIEGFVLVAIRIGGLQELYEHDGMAIGNHQLELLQARILPLLGSTGCMARLETDRLMIMVQRRVLEASRGGISGWLDSLLVVMRQKLTLGHDVVYLQPRLGISRYPEDGHQMDALVYRSERALHDTLQLKREWHFFDKDAEREVRRVRQLEVEFVSGLRAGQLRLHLQPIVDGRDGALMLSEALVRWQHPEHGLMGSGAFMPIVESAKLDVALGRWVVKESIATILGVNEQGHALHLSINVTVRHMMDKRFLADLEPIFQYPALCHQLTLELVESQLPDDIAALASLFQKIRSHGVALALDDFGTGYSSLSQLQQLPFDKLKIDRQFVMELETSKGQAMIDAMLGLADAFSIAVVAEGIETLAQREALLAHGCHLHQGYLYSKPLPAEEVIQTLQTGKHWLPPGLTYLPLAAFHPKR